MNARCRAKITRRYSASGQCEKRAGLRNVPIERGVIPLCAFHRTMLQRCIHQKRQMEIMR